MKRDIFFGGSKRFKLDRGNREKDFRLGSSPKWPNAKADNLKSKHLLSRVKATQNLSALFFERQEVNKLFLRGLPII